MTKRVLNKEKKRTDILDAAYELFTTLGFARTTILGIALKAGVGKGTFYLYFDSKEDVRDVLIARKSSELLLSAVESLERHIEETGDVMNLADKVLYATDCLITKLSKDIALLQFISKHLSWGLLSGSKSIKHEDDEVLDFKTFFMDIIEKEQIVELINSTCHNVILMGEPVTYSDYKPYLFRTIRLIIEDAING